MGSTRVFLALGLCCALLSCANRSGFECIDGVPYLMDERFDCDVCYRSQGCHLSGSTWECPVTADLSCTSDSSAGLACCSDDCITCGGGGDGDADSDVDGDADGDRSTTPGMVDILFVVDNSGSMAAEQEILRHQIVIMLEELTSPSSDAPAVTDLHVGVVTTDMGTYGYPIMTCNNPMSGDNGVLWNIGRLEGCQASYSASDCARAECPWLSHSAAAPDDGSDPSNPPIWEDFGCIATLGTGGCGFEQQLEASMAALSFQADPGGANDGFLRPDSLLVIVYVTDEDDCSTPNGEMFNTARDDYGPPNVRCALNPSELYPIDRYHEYFSGLRRGFAGGGVVVAAIVGIPIDTSWNPGDPIDRLRELQQVNPSNPNELLPICQTANGLAFPAVRIAELVYSFANDGILESICRSDWTPALQAITRKIQSKLPPP